MTVPATIARLPRMLFNSYPFLFEFLPIALIGFFLIGRVSRSGAATWLALASLVFYGYWSLRALPLLLGSILVNFTAGRLLCRQDRSERWKNWCLGLAVALNLLVLAWFKYAGWFLDSVRAALPGHLAQSWTLPAIVLPIGISFFTFTQTTFLVDCRKGKVIAPGFMHYLLFVSYFPHLIAGPVLHHQQLMPQLLRRETYRPRAAWIATGLMLFTIGLAKKLLLADPLGEYATRVFHIAGSAPRGGIEAWLGVFSYTFQIYFDFSGYTDMALGLSALFGIQLPINFDSPYKATSIIDFWRRWHITLSTFLRDYLYIPLGGSRRGTPRRYANLMTTMLLGGLWHGANWTFVLWGAAHGGLLVINHAWHHVRGVGRSTAMSRTAAWTITFIAVCLCWVLFRSASIADAAAVYSSLFGRHGFGSLVRQRDATVLVVLAASFVICLAAKNSNQLFPLDARVTPIPGQPRWQPSVAWLATAVVLFNLCLYKMADIHTFLYFQF